MAEEDVKQAPTDGTTKSTFRTPCQVFRTDGVELVPESVATSFYFDSNQHISNANVVFSEVTHKLADGSEISKFAKMSFPAGTNMQIRKITKHELVEKRIWTRKFAEKVKLSKKYHAWSLTVSFVRASASFEGIMVEKAGNLTQLRDFIQGHPGKKVAVAFILRGTDNVQKDFDALQTNFSADVITDPLKVWYPESTRYHVQSGSVIEPAHRPDYVLPTSYSFFPHGASLVNDYLTRMAFGTYQDHEYVIGLLGGKEFQQCELVLVKSVGMADRSFFLFIAPQYEEAARFQPGDVLTIMFGETQETEDSSNEWSATVQDPLPFSPKGYTTAIVNRPWDATANAYIDQDIADKALSLSKLGDVIHTREAIKDAEGIRAKFRYHPSEDVFKRVIATIDLLFKIHQRHETKERQFSPSSAQLNDMQVFLNNAPIALPKIDFYESVESTNIEENLELDPQQLEAIKSLRHTTGGWALVEGPPGTGKTHFLVQACIPFFRSSKNLPILCLSATNAGVDDIAIKADEQLAGVTSKSYVIRLHAITTEGDAALAAARKGRTIPDNAKPRIFQDLTEEEVALVDSVESIRIMYARMVQKTHQLHEGIYDKRFVVLKLSLGYRVLQVLGHADGGEELLPGSDEKYSKLSSAFETFVADEKLSKEDMIELRKLLKELQIDLIKNAAMVVATVSAASSAILYSSMDPEVIFVDEAARASEPELLAISAHFPCVRAKCIIGDIHQLRPVAYSSALTKDYPGHNFSRQLTVSLMHRLQHTGFPVVSLRTQYRAIPQLSAAYNNVIYHRELVDHPSILNRAIVERLSDFNMRVFNKKSPIIFADLPNSVSKSNATRSQYNYITCSFILDLVDNLFKEPWMTNKETGSLPTVAILVCYQAQYLLYSAFKDQLSRKNVKWINQIDIDKIDRRQGQEWDCVIIDLIVTERLGFLRDKNRLNVLFSRARSGLFVVGSKEKMDLFPHKGEVPWLKLFYNQYRSYRQQIDYVQATSNHIDFSTIDLDRPDYVPEETVEDTHKPGQPVEPSWGDSPPLASVPSAASIVNAAVSGEAAGDWGTSLDEANLAQSKALQEAWDATGSGSSNVAAVSGEAAGDWGTSLDEANLANSKADQDAWNATGSGSSNVAHDTPPADDEQSEDMMMKDGGFEHGDQSEHEVSEREDSDDQSQGFDDAMGN